LDFVSKWQSHRAVRRTGAARQILSALHRRRTAQHGAASPHGAVRRRTALNHYANACKWLYGGTAQQATA